MKRTGTPATAPAEVGRTVTVRGANREHRVGDFVRDANGLWAVVRRRAYRGGAAGILYDYELQRLPEDLEAAWEVMAS